MIKIFTKFGGIIGIFILLMLTLSLTGCGAGRTMVLALVETPVKFTSAELYEDKATANVPGDINATFEAKLAQLLYGPDGFTRVRASKSGTALSNSILAISLLAGFGAALAAPAKAP